MQACLFCSIVEGKIPAQIVHTDEHSVAFKDINPQAPLHILIIPRKHIATLNHATPEDNPVLGHLFQVAKKLAEQFGTHESGYRTVFNVNEGAGQTVFHIHLHLLGGRMFSWPPG